MTSKTRESSGTHLERSIVAVVTNTAATGVLGAAFWILAANLFEASAVAASVAASSLLIALSSLAQLNLSTALSRFLPGAGGGQFAVVKGFYAAAVGCATGVAIATAAVGWWRGGSIVDGGDFSLTLVVALSIPLWVVFSLQDGVLVAVRRAHWLPVENGLVAVAKLALLPALFWLPGKGAILTAWVVPAIPAVLIVNRVIFRKLLIPQNRLLEPAIIPLVRFAAADLVGMSATVLSLRLVPLAVVEIEGGDVAAYVGVAWTIVAVAALALTEVSRMVLSEISHQPESENEISKKATKVTLMIFVPVSLAGAILAYPTLLLAGDSYASTGAIVLGAGILGLIPASVVECRLAQYRYRGQLADASRHQIVRGALLLALVFVSLIAGRPEAVGISFAASNLASLLFVRSPK